jgi:hypothetical protein
MREHTVARKPCDGYLYRVRRTCSQVRDLTQKLPKGKGSDEVIVAGWRNLTFAVVQTRSTGSSNPDTPSPWISLEPDADNNKKAPFLPQNSTVTGKSCSKLLMSSTESRMRCPASSMSFPGHEAEIIWRIGLTCTPVQDFDSSALTLS